MKLTNIIPKKIFTKPCHKTTSQLMLVTMLNEKITQIENKNLEFSGKYINITTDITRLSNSVLKYQVDIESNDLKVHGPSKEEKNKEPDDILNERLKEWCIQEKKTAIPSIIYRKIDREVEEKGIKLSGEVKEKIMCIINKLYIPSLTLEKKSSVISMMNALKTDFILNKQINMMAIKNKLINDIKKEAPEEFKFLVAHFHKNDEIKQNEKLLTPDELAVYHDIPIVREITGKMISDVYYSLIEHIYNILFSDTKTGGGLDFRAMEADIKNKIKSETVRQELSLYQNKSSNKKIDPEDEKRLITENFIRREFYSKIKVTPYSPEKEREKLFEMLDKSLSNDSFSNQRATLNPVVKFTPPSEPMSSSVKNISDQDTDDLINTLEKIKGKGDISDQRATLNPGIKFTLPSEPMSSSIKNIPDQDTDDLIKILQKNQGMSDAFGQRAVLQNK
ncbi:hypothetical protein [Morganella morganii]|uniref:hypothetical protein n=1 Tax=Morganella morganii TaxID=582 RepID=UPI0021D076E7|nr:hypothetical protein [Morganella morganii]MCU6374852.1 hypothetical protein [Morganella morganii]